MFYNRFALKNDHNGYKRRTYLTHCRYCGKDVFYHENEYGSRVFLEALGRPWPKHRCREYLNRHTRNK